METTTTATERGFATGEHVVLRPVLETDLAELAKLMAENPYAPEPTPWTYQRLKKKFEDKDKPGLWDREDRTYAVVRRQGGVVGFIHEETEKDTKHWCELHIAMHEPDCDILGRDMVAAYLAYKQRWYRPRRISFALLLLEHQKVAWLTAAGFERELVFEQSVLHQGRPVALAFFTWIADWALASRGERHKVAGEANPRSR